MVGSTFVGDFCYVPITVEGVPFTGLIYTGSIVTLVRPDVAEGGHGCLSKPPLIQLSSTVPVSQGLKPVSQCCRVQLSQHTTPGPNQITATAAPLPANHMPPARPPDATEDAPLNMVQKIWAEKCRSLDTQQQKQLWQLVMDFKESFTLSEDQVRRTQLLEHQLNVGPAGSP